MNRPPFVHDTGAGPAVVLLHAFPLDGSQWDHQVAAWSDRYRCLRPDIYGCGGSALPDSGAVSLEEYAGDVLGVLDSIGVDSFACVGLSLGGYVALALLAIAPERLRVLVLANTTATADTAARVRERRGVAERALREGIDFLVESSPDTALSPRSRAEAHVVDPLRGRVRGWSSAAIAAVEGALAERPGRTDLLAGIRVPTLVVGGSEDRVTPPGTLDDLAAAIPGAERHTFAGIGHLCNLEAPHDFNRIAGGFLDAALHPEGVAGLPAGTIGG